MTRKKKTPPKSFFYDGSHFLHEVLGDYLIDEFNACLINGSLHVFDGNVYSATALHKVMISVLKGITDRQRKEVIAYLTNSPETPQRTIAPPELIPLKSKVYDIANDKFLDYSPDLVFLNRFPWDYDPLAPASKAVDDLLLSVTSCDRKLPSPEDLEIYELLLEAIGSVLFRVNRYRASFMLYGASGNNGKSTLLNMLNQFIGQDNVSHLSLQDTSERFRLMAVYGKAANIGDDIPDRLLNDTSIYKKLVTGEDVMAERKGVDPISFRPYAKFFFAANNLPPVSDRSRAFFSRLMVIPLERDFSKDGNAALKDYKWTEADMTYLMRLAIPALRRVIAHGRFIMPAKVKALVQDYEIENDPVLGFLNEYEKRIEGRPTTEIYTDFEVWCARAGHRYPIARKKFTREVRNHTGLTIKSQRISGNPVDCFVLRMDL